MSPLSGLTLINESSLNLGMLVSFIEGQPLLLVHHTWRIGERGMAGNLGTRRSFLWSCLILERFGFNEGVEIAV